MIGIVGALWSGRSGYVGAFGRAINRIYEIEAGLYKLRPVMLLMTLIAVLLARSSPSPSSYPARSPRRSDPP